MTLHYEDGHGGLALDRVSMQYRESERLRGLIAAIVEQVQALEDGAWSVYTGRPVEIIVDGVTYQATGVQLDDIGEIVGMPRGYADDDAYRAILRGAIRAWRSSGTVPDLIDVFVAAIPGCTPVIVCSPCDVYVYIDGVGVSPYVSGGDMPGDQPGALPLLLYRSLAAGIGGAIGWSDYDADETLTLCDSSEAGETDPGTGLGDTSDPDVGGYLAHVRRIG